ncbi:GNAT family N-acetyltransferase [Streptomyces sp. NPDC016845]|uniref:GNAT family N-acetyltransferase n=1 Tax=Streptomyces sp. NPDC016845 TaxID=3364972 RepID=UPI00379BC44E
MTVVGNGGEITFRRATGVDTAEVLSVLDEAAEWLTARGVSQWPPRFDPGWVTGAITRGETWLVDLAGEAVGTVTLDWADPLWDDLAGKAGYVHRLAVRRRAAGVGVVALSWARDTAWQHGADALRLDCVRENERLRSYYEAYGFAHRGDRPVGGAPGQRQDDGPVTWVSRYELTPAPGRP